MDKAAEFFLIKTANFPADDVTTCFVNNVVETAEIRLVNPTYFPHLAPTS